MAIEQTSFSLIIPTRNRAKYLKHSIQSCLDQEYNNYEVIVGNNASEDTTNEILHHIENEKLKIVNSETSISMSKNFEKCLNEASGDYIIIIGDDDFLVPNSLSYLDSFIKSNNSPSCISQPLVFYKWPNPEHGKSYAEVTVYKFLSHDTSHFSRDCLTEFKKSLKSGSHTNLPNVYHGCIKKSSLEYIQKIQGTQQLINGSAPDVYLSIVLALTNKILLVTSKPFTIRGSCPSSNSGNWIQKNSINRTEFIRKKQKEFGEIAGSCGPSAEHEIFRNAIKYIGFSEKEDLRVDYINLARKVSTHVSYAETWLLMYKDFLWYSITYFLSSVKTANLSLILEIILGQLVFVIMTLFWLTRTMLRTIARFFLRKNHIDTESIALFPDNIFQSVTLDSRFLIPCVYINFKFPDESPSSQVFLYKILSLFES